MKFRDKLAINVAPMPIRLVIAITFLWAGLGKILGTFEPSDAQRDILQSQGLVAAPQTPSSTVPASLATRFLQDEQEAPESADAPPPEEGPDAPSEQDEPAPEGDETPEETTAEDPAADSGTPPDAPATSSAGPVRNWNRVALLLDSAANPPFDEDTGARRMALWPAALAKKPVLMIMVVLLVATELVGGLCVLVGFLTRMAGFSLCIAMLVAMWLTQIGPAIQQGETVLGFIPNHNLYDVGKWQPLFWQLILAASAFSLALSGAGSLSLDKALWGPKSADAKPTSNDGDEE